MILNSQVTLTGTAQEIVGPATQRQVVHLHNMTKSSNQYIHIGNSTLTLTNSIHLDPGESKMISLEPTDTLYALSEPSGLTLGILVVRQSQ